MSISAQIFLAGDPRPGNPAPAGAMLAFRRGAGIAGTLGLPECGNCRDAGDHPGGRLFAEADGDFRSVFRQKDRMGGAAVPCAVQNAEDQSV